MNDSLSVFIDKNIAIRKQVKEQYKAAEENPVTNEELRALLDNPNEGRRYVGIKTDQGVVVANFLFCRTMLTGIEDKEAFDEQVTKVVEEAKRLRGPLTNMAVYGFHRTSNHNELYGSRNSEELKGKQI